jgi:hypothetical protein
MTISIHCSRCKQPMPPAKQRYCAECRKAYANYRRKTVVKSEEAKRRDNARSYSRTYYQRGLVQKTPCCVCGSSHSERHHPDYNRPLFIYWLCREHHSAWHVNERSNPAAKIEEWLPDGSAPARIGPPEFISRDDYAAFVEHPRA